MLDTSRVGVSIGLDVGKSTHHGHGLTPIGKKVFDKPLPNSESPSPSWRTPAPLRSSPAPQSWLYWCA